MTTYNFSTLTNGQTLSFNPVTDQLVFDIPPGSTTFRYLPNELIIYQAGNNLVLGYPSLPANGGGRPALPAKKITLSGMTLEQVTGRNEPINIRFSSGGALIVGDDTADTINDDLTNGLVGTDFNDMLLGMGGDDALSGRLGNDWLDGGEGDDTLYGDTGADKLYGGGGDDYLDGGLDADIMMGGDGNDTYEVAQSSDIVVEVNPNIAGGVDTVKTVISYTLTANVENLILVDRPLPSPSSTINNINGAGNSLDNTIIGNSGFNTLDGGIGADVMIGGSGDDVYVVDDVGDVVIERDNNNFTGNDGTGYILIDWVDTVQTTISYTLPDFVEHLRLMGGTDLNGTGNDLDNIIYANTGDNVIDGGGNSALSDVGQNPGEYATLAGDTVSYQFGATAGITVTLGLDTPQNTLGSGVDTLIGVENVIGSPYDDILTGDALANVLGGGGGWRKFEANSGADLLIGGDGNDNYIVDGSDTVVETNAALTQIDTVYSWVDYRLPENVENLRLLPLTGVYPTPTSPPTVGIGNTLNNVIIGNAAANRLDGGVGADTLYGGAGNDTYIVDHPGDRIYETLSAYPISIPAGGIDTVRSSVSFTLGGDIENLQLMGDADLNGTGNALANTLWANRGNNVLDGGAGLDTVSYEFGARSGVTVDLHLSVAQATGGSGFDTLLNVEHLTGSSYDDFITGNHASANTLDGGLGSDTISYASAAAKVIVNLGGLGVAGTATGGGGSDTLRNFENVIGSAFDDSLVGTTGNNILDGGAGTDTVSYDLAYPAGLGAGVTIDLTRTSRQNTGGSGFDTLLGIENLTGTKFDDDVTGNAGANVLIGLGGADTLRGGGGDDWVEGGAGDDALEGGVGTDTLSYRSASAAVAVGVGVGVTVSLGVSTAQETIAAGTDTISGFENLIGSAFNDTLTGSSGNNLLEGGAGNDILDGGAGIDTLSYQSTTGAVTVNLGLTTQTTVGAGVDTISNFENLIGGSSNDKLTGSLGGNVIEGGAGNDILDGGAGVDTLSYQSAAGGVTLNLGLATAQVTGGAGTDTILNQSFENLLGSAFNDSLSGDANDNILDGGGGIDTLSYQSASVGVVVDLNRTTAQVTGAGTDTLRNFENLRGGAFDDRLTGNAGDNLIDGGAGNDSLNGGAGTDTVSYQSASLGVTANLLTGQATGGAGADTVSNFENLIGSNYNDILIGGAGGNLLEGGSGNDTLDGGDGVDTLSYRSATLGVTVNLGLIVPQVTGGAGIDTISNFENLRGGNANDRLTGNSGNNLLEGDAGNDTLDGGAGTDTLSYQSAALGVTVNLGLTTAQVTGGAGTDTLSNLEDLIGSAFNDTLSGDSGNNVLDGGAGADTLSYQSAGGDVTIDLGRTTAQVTGGAGTDTIANFENLIGGNGNDSLSGNAGDNTLDGGVGIDTLSYQLAGAGVTIDLGLTAAQATGGAGNDTIRGFENLLGSGFNDTLSGDRGANLLNGGAGTDTLSYRSANGGVAVNLGLTMAQSTGGGGVDTILGFENLLGSGFRDQLTGNLGNNVIDGGADNDTLNGGAGTDTLSYQSAASGVTVSLGLTTAQATGGAGTDTISNFESLLGSGFNDTLSGNGGNNVMDGGAGIDALSYQSASGGVTLNLSLTTAQVTGGAGTDTIKGFENLLGSGFSDTLSGNTGDNVIDGGAGNDTLNGGTGTDTVSYQSASGGVTLSLGLTTAQVTGGAGTDTILSFENLLGGRFDDRLTGSTGTDIIDGGAGNDTLNGGTGTDTLSYLSAAGGVTVNLGLTAAQATGGAGTDTVLGFENLLGGNFNDRLTGSAGNNVIDGGAGYDELNGGEGTDTVSYQSAASAVTVNLGITTPQPTGGAGTDTLVNFENLLGSRFGDTLNGSTGNNTLTGGLGADTLSGGAGADAFKFVTVSEGGDSLTDFTAGRDKIQVVSANFGGLSSGTLTADRFKLTGTTLTNANPVFIYNGSTGALSFDSNGNGAGGVSLVATLIGPKALTAGDIQVVAA